MPKSPDSSVEFDSWPLRLSSAQRDCGLLTFINCYLLEREKWGNAHHWLIWHGRRVCSARNPACEDCCLKGVCKRNGL